MSTPLPASPQRSRPVIGELSKWRCYASPASKYSDLGNLCAWTSVRAGWIRSSLIRRTTCCSKTGRRQRRLG
ncbi:hypothetical protein AAC387_Pa12g0930 [Persea americana]